METSTTNNKSNTQIAFPSLTESNSKTALTFGEDSYSYSDLHLRINQLATALLANKKDLQEERIAFLIPGSLDYVTSLLGIWRSGAIAVPLNTSSAIPELKHALGSATVARIIINPDLLAKDYFENLSALCTELSIAIVTVSELLKSNTSATKVELPQLDAKRRAMILFTSGTTNKPKGVVTTHGNIHSQITTLLKAWAWSETDSIPLFLPLHHVHGIINVLCCGLWIGATVDLYAKFDMDAILAKVAERKYSVFMAVPTIYAKVIQHLKALSDQSVKKICSGFTAMRLNISGSAACPVPIYKRWLELTEQVLLERYGMTEIGMGISNPYHGERRAGAVGLPLPGVNVALFDESGKIIEEENVTGEIRIKGPAVFLEYWDNKKATEESFSDGWFLTGDEAIVEDGYYRIMGRSSIDIIKSGGYKLSALEIEGVLLNHDAIEECAVIGVPDDTWGESVTAFLVLRSGSSLELDALRLWCKDKMSSYKIPKSIIELAELPRNAMGKVTKPKLKDLL